MAVHSIDQIPDAIPSIVAEKVTSIARDTGNQTFILPDQTYRLQTLFPEDTSCYTLPRTERTWIYSPGAAVWFLFSDGEVFAEPIAFNLLLEKVRTVPNPRTLWLITIDDREESIVVIYGVLAA